VLEALLATTQHFFGSFIHLFASVSDPSRQPELITYPLAPLLFTATWDRLRGRVHDWKLKGTTYLWMFPFYGSIMSMGLRRVVEIQRTRLHPLGLRADLVLDRIDAGTCA
jgi:hypothetical protein